MWVCVISVDKCVVVCDNRRVWFKTLLNVEDILLNLSEDKMEDSVSHINKQACYRNIHVCAYKFEVWN
jgi:hypothetical protein